jgi:Asp-tRNA(Asn)/Glu-tRNA(Gln) amidotransferase A subunit family amidase
MTRTRSAWLVAVAAVLASSLSAQGTPFRVEEATIAEIEAALSSGRASCRDLVSQYLRRIDQLDRNGPALNALVAVNPNALAVADSLDRRMRSSGPVGSLHCVPMIVKDNFETTELPVTAGSLSLKGFVSNQDAFMVRRIKQAGAIVLAKSNMAEFAFSPYETVSSILPGYSKNPYALDRVTAGSSGGTAAAVAANLGAAGLGTDTGNSIRGPSSHQALVGIRSTIGLTSRAGVVPLLLFSDIAGPMARTVADAARVFQVVVGEDPADPVTAAARDHPPEDYLAALVEDGLRDARIGVLRQAYDSATTDAEILGLFDRALRDLERRGATIIDPVRVDSLDAWVRARGAFCFDFKHDLNAWLAGHGDRIPMKSLEAIIKSRQFHPSVEKRLETSQAFEGEPADNPACARRTELRAKLQRAVLELMDRNRLDALVYPTWSNPPRKIGDLNTPAGDNSQVFSPTTGFPAVTVPMGFTRNNTLPAGLQLLGRPWRESVLIRLAYAYEQATRHRRPPPLESRAP